MAPSRSCTYNRERLVARGLFDCKSFCRAVWISPLSAWPCTHIMCKREVVVCDRFVATTALFPIIDSIGPFLSDFARCCKKKKKKIESERERERSTMAENVHYIHADRPLVTHRTIKSKLNPWYIVRPRFKMERIFRDSRNSMGGQLNGQLNRKKKLGISSEKLAFSFFSLFFIFHHVPFHSIRTRFPSVYNLFRLLFFSSSSSFLFVTKAIDRDSVYFVDIVFYREIWYGKILGLDRSNFYEIVLVEAEEKFGKRQAKARVKNSNKLEISCSKWWASRMFQVDKVDNWRSHS